MIHKLNFINIRVRDQVSALNFFATKLGFTLLTDHPIGPGERWIELRAPMENRPRTLHRPRLRRSHRHLHKPLQEMQ